MQTFALCVVDIEFLTFSQIDEKYTDLAII